MPQPKLYLENLPPGIHYPDDDPYILKLKEKYPGTLVNVEGIRRFRAESAIMRHQSEG